MTEYQKFYESIPNTWDYITKTLNDAYKNRSNPLRTMNMAYVIDNIPVCRTVVLRYCHHDVSFMQFHTDYRAVKVKNLQINPHIALHFYDKESKVQLCMNGIASIHYQDTIAETAWQKTQFLSRHCYITSNPPSIECDSDPLIKKNIALNLIETEHGYYNFSVIKVVIDTIDFLYLDGNGNKRILFEKDTLQESTHFKGKWINP